jgi:hypothetical protein
LCTKLKNSKFGAGFAAWVEARWKVLVENPKLRPEKVAEPPVETTAGGSGRSREGSGDAPVKSADAKPKPANGAKPPEKKPQATAEQPQSKPAEVAPAAEPKPSKAPPEAKPNKPPSKKKPTLEEEVVEDPRGVYGYMPTEQCSVRNMLDFSNPEQVAKARVARQKYHAGLEKKRIETNDFMEEQMKKGLSEDQATEKLSDKRNADRIATYKDNPDGLRAMRERNRELYGEGMEDGPSYGYLRGQGKTNADIIHGATKSNRAMDVLLGLDKP